MGLDFGLDPLFCFESFSQAHFYDSSSDLNLIELL